MRFGDIYQGFILLFVFDSILAEEENDAKSYEKAILTSLDGNLTVSIFKPSSMQGEDSDASYFYESTRFDHGSMIGNMTYFSNILYDTDLWRSPHNPWNVESGVGLASEFGFGDNGAYCGGMTCYWKSKENEEKGGNFIINGVLGYEDALPGEPFLKIGVGSLIKGSCNGCDGTEAYQFNNPYKFSGNQSVDEKWTFQQTSESTITMKQKASLKSPKNSKLYGYQLEKDISLKYSTLEVEYKLTNLGEDDFHTPWYSHHFFTCDSKPVGTGYKVDFLKSEESKPDLRRNEKKQAPIYEEPGVGSWSMPIATYSRITNDPNAVSIAMSKSVEKGTKIKASFLQESAVNGNFVLHGCQRKITENLINSTPGVSMYAVNIYIEDGTISPEPLILLSVKAGQTISWTQRLEFDSDRSTSAKATGTHNGLQSFEYAIFGIAFFAVAYLVLKANRTSQYSPVP